MSTSFIHDQPWLDFPKRPVVYAIGAHLLFFGFIFSLNLFQELVPEKRDLSPLEIVVVGESELPKVQKKARPRVKLADFKKGVVVSEKKIDSPKTNQAKKAEPSRFSGLVQTTQKLGGPGSDKPKPKPSGEGSGGDQKAFALLAKNMKKDFGSGVESLAEGSGFKTVDRLPEKMSGVQWKYVKPPKVKTSIKLSVKELEKLRLLFASKWLEIRDCYEKALLYDSKLAGFLNLQVQVGSGGSVSESVFELKGAGSTQSQRVLKSCLGTVTSKMNFWPRLKGQKLQVGYRLRS